MSPLVAYHATRHACRGSIREKGLLPSNPPGRPFGVYVYSDSADFDHPTFSRKRCIRWGSGYRQDVWRVGYIGPLLPDKFVENGMILLDTVTDVTLVTGNNGS